MQRFLVQALAIAPLAFAAGCRSAKPVGPPTAAFLGRPAPELDLAWLDGAPASALADLRGRVVLLEFWRTWCGPCLSQVGHLNELNERYEADGLVVVGVTNEAGDVVSATVEQSGVGYPVALTHGAATDEAYGIRAVPRAFLIDRAGILVWIGHPATLEEERVRALLAQR